MPSLCKRKNKQCKSAIIVQCCRPNLSDFCSRPGLTQPYNHTISNPIQSNRLFQTTRSIVMLIYPGVSRIYLLLFWSVTCSLNVCQASQQFFSARKLYRIVSHTVAFDKQKPSNVRFHMRLVISVPLVASMPASSVSLSASAYRMTASWNAPTKLFTCKQTCHVTTGTCCDVTARKSPRLRRRSIKQRTVCYSDVCVCKYARKEMECCTTASYSRKLWSLASQIRRTVLIWKTGYHAIGLINVLVSLF